MATAQPHYVYEENEVGQWRYGNDKDEIELDDPWDFSARVHKGNEFETLADRILDSAVQIRLLRKRNAAAHFHFRSWPGDEKVINLTLLGMPKGWPSPLEIAGRFGIDKNRIVEEKLWPDVATVEKIRGLETQVAFLKHQLQNSSLYLRIFNTGGAALIAALFSLIFWYFTGIGGPLHPAFAALLVPVSVGLIVMAFLARPPQKS